MKLDKKRNISIETVWKERVKSVVRIDLAKWFNKKKKKIFIDKKQQQQQNIHLKVSNKQSTLIECWIWPSPLSNTILLKSGAPPTSSDFTNLQYLTW